MTTQKHARRHRSYTRSALAAGFLALSMTGANAAEGPLTPTELAYGNAIICNQNGVPVSEAAHTAACQKYLSGRTAAITETEKQAVIDGVCLSRHQSRHISFFQACKGELSKLYSSRSIPINPDQILATLAPKTNGPTVLGSCAKGAGVVVGTGVVLQVGAFIADVFGCLGACSVAVAKYNSVSIPVQIAAGCAGGVTVHAIDAMTSDTNGPAPTQMPPARSHTPK